MPVEAVGSIMLAPLLKLAKLVASKVQSLRTCAVENLSDCERCLEKMRRR